MRIAHLPTSVGGHAWGLSQAEKLLGYKSDVIYLRDNYLNYQADKIIFPGPASGLFSKAVKFFPLLNSIRNIANNYDIFHFNFGSSLLDINIRGLHLMDLPYFKKHGKIIVTYNGCDARQKYPTMERVNYSACHNAECYNGICNSGSLDKIRSAKIRRFNKYADAIFALNPDLFHFLPSRTVFLPYVISRWNEIENVPQHAPISKLNIVHAPTNKAAKGSEIIIKAVEDIKLRYPGKVNFTLVENIPNSEALKIYAGADLIIDQILIGWYGGFAVEAMKMGKPVMAFIRKEDLKYIPEQMANDCLNAFINVNSENLHERLRNIVENPDILLSLHNTSLGYVNKWHNPSYVAEIVSETYKKVCAE